MLEIIDPRSFVVFLSVISEVVLEQRAPWYAESSDVTRSDNIPTQQFARERGVRRVGGIYSHIHIADGTSVMRGILHKEHCWG